LGKIIIDAYPFHGKGLQLHFLKYFFKISLYSAYTLEQSTQIIYSNILV